ncbi:MAG: hypothetical protein LBH05_06615 [Deferribacteraceae bacterium]|jgi:hypothetical protein|nr:hypothetical protein [Deferribacteraceae bacterium]
MIFIAVSLVIAGNAVTKQSIGSFYLHGLPSFIKNIPLAKTVNVMWNCCIILALVFLYGCAVTQKKAKQSDLPMPDAFAADIPVIYSVEIERYKGNYRLKFVMDNPYEAFLETSGNVMYIKFPANTGFTSEASAGLRGQDSPCVYNNASYINDQLVIALSCAKGVKVYPEISAEKLLDLIISR